MFIVVLFIRVFKSELEINYKQLGVVVYPFRPNTQVSVCEFKASLTYKVCFRTIRAT